ncbi:sensor domain-containing diguanylate cyclase [Gilvimarinus polysaccharolyticus]|uniref:sensor domain-containing diguanylate cyclase n=1 Tax=Gilvimarinus polysaccharolyticus TaxID=863921 RepID=UPI0006739C1E|nr:sensor domain-containing diguanylate cyclase [Gilvimarinus polysaccharolyticus]
MIQRKLFFVSALCLLLLVGFLATSLVSYFVAKDSVAAQLQEQMLPLTSDNIYSEIQRDLLQPLLISSLMAHDTFVTEWVISGEQEPARIAEYLTRIQNKYDTITAFFVSEKTRNYYHPSGIIKKVDSTDPADSWYFHARQLTGEHEINVDHDTADPTRLSIFVNYRVLDERGDLVGITGVGLSVASVMALIEDYQKRYGRIIYFVDRNGQLALHGSGFNSAMYLKDKVGQDRLLTQVLTSQTASLTYNREDGNKVYLNSRLVPEFDWYLVVEQINDPAAQRIERALVLNILVSLAITVIVVLLAHLTVRGYQRRLEKMATQDKLTGAANRQAFDWVFARAVKNTRRRNTPLALASMDLDHFKEINDSYGHQRGDEVLRTVSAVIASCVRDSDTLCRWGGEEFLLLLENCDLAQAEAAAEAIRAAVEAHEFRFGDDSIHMTMSFGVTVCHPGEPFNAILDRVDSALYRAKDEGRNRVCVQA